MTTTIDLTALGAAHARLHRVFGDGPHVCLYCRSAVVCACGGSYEDPGLLLATLDHIEPRSRGGSDKATNLAIACLGCNTSKNRRRWPDEWIHDRNRNTVIRGCTIRPLPGDRLSRRGAIALLAELSPFEPYPLISLADLVGERPDALRNELERLERAGRLLRFARPAGPLFAHEYTGLEVVA